MSEKTSIEWTGATWNPLRGTKGRWHCVRISGACKHCYAATMNHRFGGPDYVVGADTPRLDAKALVLPLRWREPRKVFVCSMTDLFLDAHTDAMIDEVFATMWIEYLRRAGTDRLGRMEKPPRHHIYQVLTKRAARMHAYFSDPKTVRRVGVAVANRVGLSIAVPCEWWPIPSLWLGVSVEDQATADARIPLLLQTPAAVRFVSYEPALGPVDFDEVPMDDRCYGVLGGGPRSNPVPGLDWIIVGGESGPGRRELDLAWLRSVDEQTRAAGVALFVKQDSGPKPGMQGRIYADLWARKEFPR